MYQQRGMARLRMFLPRRIFLRLSCIFRLTRIRMYLLILSRSLLRNCLVRLAYSSPICLRCLLGVLALLRSLCILGSPQGWLMLA